MKKILPVGNDSFLTIRENDWYYVDKTLLIKDFIEYQDTVALITRPRRFGKTLNMTMLREFFDITKDSKAIFKGLAIMDEDYSAQINSRPVIYLSFKDCTGKNSEELKSNMSNELFNEYRRYHTIFGDNTDKKDLYYIKYYKLLHDMAQDSTTWMGLGNAIDHLLTAAATFFGKTPILLIDEYDQPILSSYQNGYREELSDFFSVFYGSVLKGNEYLGQALLTGIQRVAKESIFSKLNNVTVYTVTDRRYSRYFGLTPDETRKLLEYYDLELNPAVKQKYNGYLFFDQQIYNPWSILNYANSHLLKNYWINTSTNYLVKKALSEADSSFQHKFEQLTMKGSTTVGINLETSFIELQNNSTLWGLLVNSGYLTIEEQIDFDYMKVKIPNDEVYSEFQKIVAEQANIQDDDLKEMLNHLIHNELDDFLKIYQKIVLSCTSYYDAKENAYHMLLLGMCISLRNLYLVTSNLEAGHGRHDIRLEARKKGYMHIIIEFKQGKDIENLKNVALQQILDEQYYAGLSGEILCLGIAHDIKRCAIAYQKLTVS